LSPEIFSSMKLPSKINYTRPKNSRVNPSLSIYLYLPNNKEAKFQAFFSSSLFYFSPATLPTRSTSAACLILQNLTPRSVVFKVLYLQPPPFVFLLQFKSPKRGPTPTYHDQEISATTQFKTNTKSDGTRAKRKETLLLVSVMDSLSLRNPTRYMHRPYFSSCVSKNQIQYIKLTNKRDGLSL
jgi:hypothetical protein